MSRIRVQGTVVSSSALRCGDWERSSAPDPATAYVSDNEPTPPPDPQRFGLTSVVEDPVHQLFMRALSSALGGDAELTQMRALPDVAYNRYWLGAALHELKRNAEAEQVLRSQRGRSTLPPIYQQWIDLRLAELALARGEGDTARALLEECRDKNDRPDFQQRWEAAWKQVRPRGK